jgi:hypothetical protein
MAFFELYPDRKHRWQADYPELKRTVSRAVGKSLDCPEWTDFYLAQWLVLRRESSIDVILDRVADGRELALEKLEEFARESAPFQKALRKAREARKMAMLIN